MGSPHILTGRNLHLFVRSRIELALGSRHWKWLAKESGVPASTLSTQMNRPKITLDVLVRVTAALDRPVSFFLPDHSDETSALQRGLVDELEALVRQVRRTLVSPSFTTSEIRKSGTQSGIPNRSGG